MLWFHVWGDLKISLLVNSRILVCSKELHFTEGELLEIWLFCHWPIKKTHTSRDTSSVIEISLSAQVLGVRCLLLQRMRQENTGLIRSVFSCLISGLSKIKHS